MNTSTLVKLLCILILPVPAFADHWPQFRGPNRDGVSSDKNLLTSWPESGPKLLWSTEGAGRGYSSLSIADGKMFTMGDALSTADDKDEYLSCFDTANAEQLWKKRLGPAWDSGPKDWQSSRSTPTIDGDRVYVLTPHGKLFCCKVSDGEVAWEVDLKSEYNGKKGDGWGYGESVLIDGDRVVCTPGKPENTMVALNKVTGEKIWSASRPGDRGAGHASIQISEVGDVKVYVNTTASGALGVRASDGELMWTFDIEKTTAVIPNPIIRDDLVFFTAGYDLGGALLRQVPDGSGGVKTEEIYPLNKQLQNKHGGVLLVGDYLYGDSGDSGVPFCAEFMTGERQWKKRGSGKGSAAITAADGHLYILFQNSTIVLAKANPDDYKEVSSFKVGDANAEDLRPTWSHPVVTGGRLYVRQDDEIFCYDISASSNTTVR